MISVTQAISMIAVASVFTFATRLVPFALFGKSKQPPQMVVYLGKLLPPAVIAILIVYCLKSVMWTSAASILPQLISAAVVVLLHLWKHSSLLSIGAGTVCYMVLVQTIFVI